MKVDRFFYKLIMVFVAIMLVITSSSSSLAVKDYEDGNYEEHLQEDEQTFGSVSEGFAKIIRGIAFGIFNLVQKGFSDTDGGEYITIDSLVFDRFEGTSINFYGTAGQYTQVLKENITKWYTFFSSITWLFYGFLLLYVGVNILLAVGGKKQEKYKEMLLIWLESVLLFMFFPYLLKFSISINTAFVRTIQEQCYSVIDKSKPVSLNMDGDINPKEGEDNEKIGRSLVKNPFNKDDKYYMAVQANRSEDADHKGSISDAFVLLIMVFQFILLIIAYYKRMFIVAFLITIFPIVMLFYPIDKLNDGKSQSFSIWSKELFVNIFTQSFHAIAYVFCIGVTTSSSGKDWILAIVGVTFLFKAEEIIKTILGVGGTKTMSSPAKSMATAAATLAAASAIGDKAKSTATNFVEGARDIKHAYDSGWRPNFGFTSAKRNATTISNVNARFDQLLELEPQAAGIASAVANTVPAITPGSLQADAPTNDLDSGTTNDVADIILNAENEEVLTVDGKDKDGNEHTSSSRLGQAAIATLENIDSGNLALSLQEHGLTGDKSGKQSTGEIKSAVNNMISQVSALDPNASDYEEKVKKINAEFQANIKVALPGLSNRGAAKFSQELMNAAIATGGLTRLNSSVTSRIGGKGVVAEMQSSTPTAVKQQLTAMDRKINGASAVADYSNLDERRREGSVVFSTKRSYTDDKGRVVLSGRARQEKEAILQAFETDSNLKKKFEGVSQSEKDEIAHRLAIVKTFREQSKLSVEEMNANLDKLAHPTIGSNGMQLFTADEVQEAAEVLKKHNHMTDGAVDAMLTSDNADVSLGANAEEVQKILQEATLVYGVDAESSGVLIDQRGNVEKITDSNRKEAVAADKRLKKAKKRATDRQKKSAKSVHKATVKRLDPATGKEIEEVVELYDESYTTSIIDQVINISRTIRLEMDSLPKDEREMYIREGYDYTNGANQDVTIPEIQTTKSERVEKARRANEARIDTRSAQERIADRASRRKGPTRRDVEPSFDKVLAEDPDNDWLYRGSTMIYPEKAKKWKDWVDARSKGIAEHELDCATAVMESLESGASVDVALNLLNSMNLEYGSYQDVRNAVLNFSKRGPEFYEYSLHDDDKYVKYSDEGRRQKDEAERKIIEAQRIENERIEASTEARARRKAKEHEGLKTQWVADEARDDRKEKEAVAEVERLRSLDPYRRESFFDTEAGRVSAARRQRLEDALADVARVSEKQTFDLDVQRVNGMTREEMVAETIRLHNEGARKLTRAATDALAAAASGAILSPVAIGLNPGGNPIKEAGAAMLFGEIAVDRAISRQETITIKDEFGEEVEVKIDPYGTDRLAVTVGEAATSIQDINEKGMDAFIDLIIKGKTSTLDIKDLRRVMPEQGLIMDIEGQLANKSAKKHREMSEADLIKEDEIRARRIGKFSNALNGSKKSS